MSLFEQFDANDARALVDAYPLAWVCASDTQGVEASLLPLVANHDADGRLIELIGHLARSNPLLTALERQPRATILFKGPDAYVSPEHAGERNWAPTWNYAQLRVQADVAFDPAFTEASLRVLIEKMESGRADPWHAGELGARYAGMLDHIIGFRARVVSVSGKFKLGQDERAETFQSIISRLPDAETVAWMRRFGEDRR